MPELPEVETIARGLRQGLVGRTFESVIVYWPRQIVAETPETFAHRLKGQSIKNLRRRGKYIVFGLSVDVLLIHLRMTGRLYIAGVETDAQEDRWVRVVFGLDNGGELRFSDARKFGRLHLVVDEQEVTGKLGFEPLSEEFTFDAFCAQIGKRRGVIKPLLLDQRFVAGIGNIYADEILWHAKVAPQRRVNTLELQELTNLYRAIRATLQDGIEYAGASISWYRRADGAVGEYQERFRVYGRGGKACPLCGTPIVRTTFGQRGTHFCPSCQS